MMRAAGAADRPNSGIFHGKISLPAPASPTGPVYAQVSRWQASVLVVPFGDSTRFPPTPRNAVSRGRL